MAKSSIMKKFSLSASGILAVDDDGYLCIENADTGDLIDLKDLLMEFADKSVRLSVAYDYGIEEE